MGKSGNPALRAEQENTEPVEYDPTPVDENGVEDFDAFWETVAADPIPVKIRGQVFHLPPALPLQFELEAQRLSKSKKDKDVRHLVALLFGQDGYKRLAAAGVDTAQFGVLLAWAPQRIGGGNMSMAETAAEIAKAEAIEAATDPS
jgi:hypothetical protein